jgi:hypothetical protein
MNILTVNLVLSTLVFWAAARIYVLPNLPRLRPQTVLLPILLMGPAYWIPAFWVPALLATHYLTFIVLTERTARWAS